MIITDTLKYFAQFVSKDVISDMFMMNNAPGYAELKQQLLALPDDRVIPGIKCLIIGPDEDKVRERISDATGTYLFIDYGSATSYINGMDVKIDKLHMSITVATPTSEDTDQPSLVLHQDTALQIMKTIRDAMRADSYDNPSMEWLPMEASTLTPFVAKALANSTGWMLEWNAQFTDQL